MKTPDSTSPRTSPRRLRFCVLGPQDGWHVQDLARACALRNQIHLAVEAESIAQSIERIDDAFSIRFSSITFDQLCDSVGVLDLQSLNGIPEFDVLLLRAMPAGSLEQIVFRMDVLHRLEAQGVLVLNSAQATEISVDKYRSLCQLRAAGLRVPETRVSQTRQQAIEDYDQFDGPVLVKPIFGSLGKGIRRLGSREAAAEYFEACVAEGMVIYQQQIVDHSGWDLRLFVLGERVIGMKRHNQGQLVTNIFQGARGESYLPSPLEVEIARMATRAVGARIAGVDLIYAKGEAEPFVLEVNAAPGWRALTEASGVDVASSIVEWVVDQFCH